MLAYADDVMADRLQALTRKLDSGGGQGKILLYTAPRPSRNGAITTQTLLATGYFQRPSAGSVTSNVLVILVDETPQVCSATGVATWGRILTSTDAFVADGDAGEIIDLKDITISDTQLYQGGEVLFLSASLTETVPA